MMKGDEVMKRTGILTFAIIFFLRIGPVWADATIESFITSSGFQGMGAFEGTAIKKYQGEKLWD